MTKNNWPIIIGSAQFTQHKNTINPLDPLSLMIKVCNIAFNEIGNLALKKYIDTIYMININSWSYEDGPSELSKALDLNPTTKVYLPDGGDSPQMLVNRAAKAIFSGKSQAILITGAEAAYSVYRAKKNKTSLNWPERKEPKYMESKLWHGTNQFENKYGMIIPSYSYAMFETAVRAASGRNLEQHRIYMGKLFEHYSKISSKNPYAWDHNSYTAEEIAIPSVKNRYINYPYTKRMCANMFVDQSAALIITSEELAEKIKVDGKLLIYLMGGAELKNIFNISQRPNLYDSPAAREGSKKALEQAGLNLQDIDTFDIYSCFPSIVEIIKKEIGLTDQDSRNLTITGGLPYFGGPWSNYSMHAICTAVNLIRENSSMKIMVVANGGYNTKQSFGIYSTEPPKIPWNKRDDSEIQESILKKTLSEAIEQANGQLTIEAYTIPYNRDGKPKKGIFIGHLSNGRRTLAIIGAQPELLLKLERKEYVGLTFPVQYDEKNGFNFINLN
jgi:acetyl-CoA C-acetyltransferase